MIKNSKVFFKTFNAFLKAIQDNQISPNSIVFIKDRGFIWTHDTLFSYPHHIFVTQEEYDALSQYEKNALYFIVENPLEPDIDYTDDQWVFGNAFPITFNGNLTNTEWEFGSTFPIIFKDGWTFSSTFPITLN